MESAQAIQTTHRDLLRPEPHPYTRAHAYKLFTGGEGRPGRDVCAYPLTHPSSTYLLSPCDEMGNFLKKETTYEKVKKAVFKETPALVGARRDEAKVHSLSPLVTGDSSDKAGHSHNFPSQKEKVRPAGHKRRHGECDSPG